MDRRRRPLRRALLASLAVAFAVCAPTVASAQETARSGYKSPAAALALSVVLPGAGQVYNGDYAKGAVMFGGTVLTVGALILTASDVLELDDDTSGTGTHILGAVGMGIILWSWIDAPLSAKAINRRLDAGAVAVDVGPRLAGPGPGRALGVTLVRLSF